MIDEKKITEAAHQYMLGEYYDNGNWEFPCDTDDIKSQCELGFIKGIGWFKSALWHNASEKPQGSAAILYLWHDEQGGMDVGIDGVFDDLEWKKFVEYIKITKWCYINDILPKGGDK